MKVRPHYLLFSESSAAEPRDRWRFVLRTAHGAIRMAAEDIEPGVSGERLELLTVVRGLEAIDEPSRVTLLTPSSYVCEGIRYGLSEWRKSDWKWESFGEMVPVKNRDLWQRVDRAMKIHQLDCRHWRIDGPHGRPIDPAGRPDPGPRSPGFPHRRAGGRSALTAPWRRWSRAIRPWYRTLKLRKLLGLAPSGNSRSGLA